MRLLILLMLFYIAYRVVKFVFAPGRRTLGHQEKRPLGASDDVMIKDPQCGVYFARKNGVHARKHGQDYYFCSEECRDRFLKS